MHFLTSLAFRLHLDEDRRKHAGDRCRGEEHVAKQLQRLGIAARGDPAHVPDYRSLCVEIGGSD
jgi:hypothetical protein